MQKQTILIYDGSFDGFLTSIFIIYELKISTPYIQKYSENSNQLFSENEMVHTELEKAKRVWKGFATKTSTSVRQLFFRAFLSEIKGVENTLFRFLKTVLEKGAKSSKDYGNPDILRISQVAKMVGREKHRMEAFVRFQLTKDDLYIATVEPDFNVLPLIIKHFKDRYADQKWMIYDIKRDYGIFYDLMTVEIINVDFFNKQSSRIDSDKLAEDEVEFQKLWKSYYQSVNIKSRKNNTLHKQHLPKRYWKYLTEKSNI